jgi:hypothetical protein
MEPMFHLPSDIYASVTDGEIVIKMAKIILGAVNDPVGKRSTV